MENKIKTSLPFLQNPKAREKSGGLLPANPAAGALSNAALPGIHQPRLWRRRPTRSLNSSRRDGAGREEGRQLGPGPETHWGAGATASSARSRPPLPAGGRGCGASAPGVPGPRPALPFAAPGEEKGGSGVRTPGWRRPRRLPPPLCARGLGAAGAAGGSCGARASPRALRAAGVRRAPPGSCCCGGRRWCCCCCCCGPGCRR